MTHQLETAFAEASKLPVEQQKSLASVILQEIESDRLWKERFASTSDEQWDRMAERVRAEIAGGEVVPLDQILPSDSHEP